MINLDEVSLYRVKIDEFTKACELKCLFIDLLNSLRNTTKAIDK